MGRIAFADVRNNTEQIQIRYNPQNFSPLTPGMHVSIDGTEGVNRRGDMVVDVNSLEIIASGAMPTYANVENQRRFPERAWLSNPETLNRIRQRASIIRNIRNVLNDRDFIEIETPILQRQYGGGEANPFITERDNQTRYLRIAPELALKRAIVGGFNRVFELGRNFRNEGRDRTHYPEFTTLEIYQAYADWQAAILNFQMVVNTAMQREVTFAVERLDSLVEARLGYTPDDDTELMAVFENEIEPHLIEPTIVTHFPISVSPLAQADPTNPRFAERFEAYVNGTEIANGYSELQDPVEHQDRMGDSIDPDYLDALQWGLPPTAGVGIGIDRLVMWATNTDNIHDIIPFPNL